MPSPMGERAHEKPKNFKESISKLIIYSKSHLKYIIVASILSIGATIFAIISPNKLSDLVDTITSGIIFGIDISALEQIAILLVFFYSANFLLNYVQNFIMATLTQSISKKLRKDISYKINKLPLKYFDSTNYGEVLSRVTNDVDIMGQTLNNSVSSILRAGTLFIGTTIMMFVTNYIMALTAIISSVIGFVFMMIIMKNSQKYFSLQQKGLGELNAHIEEIYSNHEIVKVYNATTISKEKFNGVNNKLYSSAWKSQFLSGLMPTLMGFIGNIGYVGVTVVGALLVNNSVITFGTIVAFMIYVRLFTNPLSQLAQSMVQLQSAAAASERVFNFLEEEELEEEINKIESINNIKGNIEFKNVKFGYLENKPVINNFSCKVTPGQKIAIVGHTGAGKTTIVNLLMKFYEIWDGDILIENNSIHDLSRNAVHNSFSMVLQDTWLFEGSIKDNIIYCKENVSEQEVINACKAVGIDNFIRTLPHGYNTILDDNTSISAGQKQLLTIARAMIQNNPILILDEATSSVDTRTEELIQIAMDKLTKNKTSFIIAHRLSTIKNADVILVMDHGDIIEQGKHEDLINKNGFYAELYNSQFSHLE